MTFGQQLREQRENQGISLDDVAGSTRISLRHLSALEEDRYADLPGGVFNRGIVRSYATCCGLDTEETVRNFQVALDRSGVSSEPGDDGLREFAEAVQRSRKPAVTSNQVRWMGVAAMVLVVMAIAAGVLWLLLQKGIVRLPENRHIPAIHRTR